MGIKRRLKKVFFKRKNEYLLFENPLVVVERGDGSRDELEAIFNQ